MGRFIIKDHRPIKVIPLENKAKCGELVRQMGAWKMEGSAVIFLSLAGGHAEDKVSTAKKPSIAHEGGGYANEIPTVAGVVEDTEETAWPRHEIGTTACGDSLKSGGLRESQSRGGSSCCCRGQCRTARQAEIKTERRNFSTQCQLKAGTQSRRGRSGAYLS